MNYKNIASGYTELHMQEQMAKLVVILSALQIKKSDRVLDVGCGTAFYFDMIPGEVLGIEPSAEMIKNSRFKDKIIKGNAENLPFIDNNFDFVISITAIHNFKNYQKGILEMKRVGKKFGFSVLKRSVKSPEIIKFLKRNFKILKIIDDIQDKIIICEK